MNEFWTSVHAETSLPVNVPGVKFMFYSLLLDLVFLFNVL